MLKNKLFLAASATLILATPASAHRAWLLPSVTVISNVGQSVTVDAGSSTEPFTPNHAAMNIDGIQAWAPDGTMGKVENAAKGKYRSTFDVAIDKPGTWRIGNQTSSVSGTFKVNGEDWAVGRRRGPPAGMAAGAAPGAGGPGAGAPGAPPAGGPAPAGAASQRPTIDPSHVVATVADIPANATDLNLTESQNRNEFFVTAGAPTEIKATGKGLEMVADTPPTDLVSNEPGKFRFLVDGKPASGLKVTVIPGGQRYRDGEKAQELTTDANGAITVNWPVAGFYWMNTSLTDDKPSVAKATKRRMAYTTTLEVVAP